MPFNKLNLDASLVAAVGNKGYTTPTPIQQQAIPAILAGKDVFGCAQTGTGKTAAFALPLIQILKDDHRATGNRPVRALVLAPTRELALQISDNFTAYGKGTGVTHTVIFGGVNQNPQVQALRRGVDVLIATPGRLIDLINQGHVKLSSVGHLVLDEADRMLDMGFINDIRKILKLIPATRQMLLFTATITPEIKKLSDGLLRQPVHVTVNPVSSTAELVQQRVYYVSREDKRSLLSHVLNDTEVPHALVFTRTKHGADKVVRNLRNTGISAEAIHGNKSQSARERAMNGFRQRRIRVLVATDIAARGIDITKLSHVINYEIPEHAETYVHRIGRTGRAGVEGTALSFCAPEERPYLKDISKLIKKNIEVVAAHPYVKRTPLYK